MRGLLVRDFCILKNQIKWIGAGGLLIVVIQLFSKGTAMMMVSCFVIATAMLTSNTISFDEAEGGFAYLFTLPVTRKGYVSEKYLVGAGMIFSVLFISGICTAVGILIPGSRTASVDVEEMILFLGGCAIMGIFYIALMIPLYLKFGATNGKLILPLVVWGLIFLLIGVVRLNGKYQWNLEASMMKFFRIAGNAGVAAVFAILAIILLTISWLCSRHIMERKEF